MKRNDVGFNMTSKVVRIKNNKLYYGILIYDRVVALVSEGYSLEQATFTAKSKVCSGIDDRMRAAYVRKWYNENLETIKIRHAELIKKQEENKKTDYTEIPDFVKDSPLMKYKALSTEEIAAELNNSFEDKDESTDSVQIPDAIDIESMIATIQAQLNEAPVIKAKYKCEICNKVFNSAQALHSHNSAKKHNTTIVVEELDESNDGEITAQQKAVQERRERKEAARQRKQAELYASPSMQSYLETVKQEDERKALENLKTSLHEELNAPEAFSFNKEAYQLAIRSMSTSEAWKLAKDEEKAKAFIVSFNTHAAPVLAPEPDNFPYTNVEPVAPLTCPQD